jgi:pyrroline-5-carboxylate reductase
MIDAMADGGVYEGLPYDLSLILSAKTALGAAKMILAGKKPSEIKEMTISPGGTTIRGLYAMEMKSARAAVTEAVIEATKRARELSKNSYTSMK